MSALAAARPSPAYRRAVNELRGNPGQWQAYGANRHCVVLAGPGSGKTKTLTVKIAKLLIESIREPRGLACITYNAECARELSTRLERLGVYGSDHVFIGTVHSFCLKKVLIPYAALSEIKLPQDFRVALPSEQELLFGRAVEIEVSADEPPRRWRMRSDEYRRTHLDRYAAEWQNDEQLAALVARYEHLLRKHGMIDFEDMVLLGLRLIESQRWVRRALHAKFPFIIVDEYQDLACPFIGSWRTCASVPVRVYSPWATLISRSMVSTARGLSCFANWRARRALSLYDSHSTTAAVPQSSEPQKSRLGRCEATKHAELAGAQSTCTNSRSVLKTKHVTFVRS